VWFVVMVGDGGGRRTALPLSADTVTGQAVVDRERASVEQHLALGLSKLRR
jgi:hypothetical protein